MLQVKGWRTLGASFLLILVGLANVAGQLDLQAILSLIIKDQQQAGALAIILGSLFAILRYVTTGPVGRSEG